MSNAASNAWNKRTRTLREVVKVEPALYDEVLLSVYLTDENGKKFAVHFNQETTQEIKKILEHVR